MSDDEGQRPTSFWQTVEWPLREALLIFLVGPVAVFMIGAFRDGWLYGLIYAWIVAGVFWFLWMVHRVMKAWAEWPAEGRWTGRLKRFIRFLLTDS